MYWHTLLIQHCSTVALAPICIGQIRTLSIAPKYAGEVLTDEILPALLKLLACGLLPTLDLARHTFSREAAEQLALALPTANVRSWTAGGNRFGTHSQHHVE